MRQLSECLEFVKEAIFYRFTKWTNAKAEEF